MTNYRLKDILGVLKSESRTSLTCQHVMCQNTHNLLKVALQQLTKKQKKDLLKSSLIQLDPETLLQHAMKWCITHLWKSRARLWMNVFYASKCTFSHQKYTFTEQNWVDGAFELTIRFHRFWPIFILKNAWKFQLFWAEKILPEGLPKNRRCRKL